MFGKKHTDETKDKISKIKKGNWSGIKNPKSKLDIEKVKMIKKIIDSKIMNKMKITTREIAEVFNVSKSTIIDIKKNRSWKNINIK